MEATTGIASLISEPIASANVIDLLSSSSTSKAEELGSVFSQLDLGGSFCQVPYKVVVQNGTKGAQKQASGLEIEAAVQKCKNGMQCRLNLKIKNTSTTQITDFLFKANVNFFGFTVDQGI